MSEDNNQASKIASTTVAMVVLALGGYGLWHVNLESSRPYSLGVSLHIPDPEDTHKVESRLWQDPFEPFETGTNQAVYASEGPNKVAGQPLYLFRAQSKETAFELDLGLYAAKPKTVDTTFCNDLERRATNENSQIAILGVMLEGGSFPENKEVRLRLRYAVEVALLTSELGPEDRTHISTNSMWLPDRGTNGFGRSSRFAYEWFTTRKDTNNLSACVLWLNEDDFADDPGLHLGTLLTNVPGILDPNDAVSFYLIGPRSSDALRAFKLSLTKSPNFDNLANAANLGHFHMLSPEASAAVDDANYGDPDNTNVSRFLNDKLEAPAAASLSEDDLIDPTNFAQEIMESTNAVAAFLQNQLPMETVALLPNPQVSGANLDRSESQLTQCLNALMGEELIYNTNRFAGIALRGETRDYLDKYFTQRTNETLLPCLNRLLLEDAFPKDISRHQFFNNWIATDQKLASLLAREVTNRFSNAQLAQTNNVVVLLSEQDTYYGSKLADEWMYAMVTNHACVDVDHVWQFAYLRGLDGSKPQAKTPDPSAALAATPEAALESALVEQQAGEKADGDAQLDYLVRLGEFLKQKDEALKNQGNGRIVAVGLTGSDVYDKLILLQELRHKLPEAVFFTTDLDAPLWTASALKYTRNLLVASAYPVDPGIDYNQNAWSEFEPFRDVYQSAVFSACCDIIANEKDGGTDSLEADPSDLAGGLYRIGRHGPVRIITVDGQPEQITQSTAHWVVAVAGFLVFFLGLVAFLAASSHGFQHWSGRKRPAAKNIQVTAQDGDSIQAAKNADLAMQIPIRWLRTGMAAILVAGFLCWIFQQAILAIAQKPGEEPFDFNGGVSIWTSEWMRFLAALGAAYFIWFAYWRHTRHRQRIWETYFHDEKAGPGTWKCFWQQCRVRWRRGLSDRARRQLVKNDTHLLRALSGKPNEKTLHHLMQAVAELYQERRLWLVSWWTPAFIENPHENGTKASVNATTVFKSYLRLGFFRIRVKRHLLELFFYVIPLFAVISCRQDFPTRLLIRGPWSHGFDLVLLVLVIILLLWALIYVLDTTLLTGRLLNCICRHATRWPDRPLKECADKYGVQPKHVDGLLDVDFAAVQTKETGPLMFGPILILMVLVLSRFPCFDDWTWPPGLIFIFAVNFLVAGICWWVVRHAAHRVKALALERLDLAINEVEHSITPPAGEDYVRGLKAMRQAIESEARGAYSTWFQDPTYLAVFIPSGITGLVPLLGLLWPGK